MVIVRPDSGHDLDGQVAQPGAPQDSMYLDPFGSNDEVPKDNLVAWVVQQMPFGDTGMALGPASPIEVILRTRNNINATVDMVNETNLMQLGELTAGASGWNLTAMGYAAWWAELLLLNTDNTAAGETRRAQRLASFVAKCFPEDAGWALDYLEPTLQAGEGLFPIGLEGELASLRMIHNQPPSVDESPIWDQSGSIYAGQVFRHRTANWIGLILGKRPTRYHPNVHACFDAQ
jgi:F-box protein 21